MYIKDSDTIEPNPSILVHNNYRLINQCFHVQCDEKSSLYGP
jgi:hypothetical protein